MVKKGVTAIIATVLLLMMTVAAAGVAYSWMMSMQKSIQKDTQDKYDADVAKVNGKLSIDSMWCASDPCTPGSTINFTLKNAGTYTFSNTSKFNIYFEGVPLSAADITYNPATALIPGMVTTVSINKPFVTVGNPKTIRVAADGGVSVPYRCEITSPTQTYCQ